MHRTPRRAVGALLIVLTIEVALALVGSVDDAFAFVDGMRGPTQWAGLVAVFWLPMVLVAIGRVTATLSMTRRDLHSRQQALAAVADTSSDWLWEADTHHRLTYNSAGVTQLLGYQPDDLLGRTTLSLMPEAQWDAADHLLRRSLQTGQGWDGIELTWRHADGNAVVLHGTAAVIKNERGDVVGFRGVRRAIRPAEVAERALAAARARVRDLLTAGSLDVALQPILDLNTGALRGAEALARFPDGRGPDAWFQDAADVGLALELDVLAFRSALALFPLLPEDCDLSVNATPELVMSGVLDRELLATGVDVPLSRLVIEITEHARVGNYAELQALLTPLRERGVQIAVDDTGAGYASLNHVLQLRPTIIKLDRSLVANLGDDRARRSLVTALVLLGLDLDASITAEGIETAQELDTLKLLGVDSGQGYFLARPTTDRERWQQWWGNAWFAEASMRATPEP